MNHYESFEVDIESIQNSYYRAEVRQSCGGWGETAFELARDAEIADALVALHEREIDEEMLVGLGSRLFQTLFSGLVGEQYRTGLGLARHDDHKLRICLNIRPPELAVLPWEYLYDPQEHVFLGTQSTTALVRLNPTTQIVSPDTMEDIQEALRILVVSANPEIPGLPLLNIDHEKSLFMEALEDAIDDETVAVQFVEQAKARDIIKAMRKFSPHVFHYIGHSGVGEDGAYLILHDRKGRPQLVDADSFGNFFTNTHDLRLIVLNSCQSGAASSGTASSQQAQASLAATVLKRIPCTVIAMQYAIPDETAIVFTQEFYECLAQGVPIEEAISETRNILSLEPEMDIHDWGIPVVFVSTPRGTSVHQQETHDDAQDEAARRRAALPTPQEPNQMPAIPNFIGRETEVADCMEKLTAATPAIVVGMPGVGKSALTSHLARQWSKSQSTAIMTYLASDKRADKYADSRAETPQQFIFWHPFQEQECITTLTTLLAKFFAYHGDYRAWEMIHADQKSPSTESLIDALESMLARQPFLYCFEDFHLVKDDMVLVNFIKYICNAVTPQGPWVILNSQTLPDFVDSTGYRSLGGFTVEETKHFIRLCGIEEALPDALYQKIYHQTDGNARLLTLICNAAPSAEAIDTMVGQLMTVRDIKRFLVNEVHKALTDDERRVMEAVAALMHYPSTEEAIETVLGESEIEVWDMLIGLTERHLLTVSVEHAKDVYAQTTLIYTFYAERTRRNVWRHMHHLAAEYYAEEEIDQFKVAYHYCHASDFEKAAYAIVDDVWAHINQGRATALYALFQEIKEKRLSAELRIRLRIAQGDLNIFLRNSDEAQRHFEGALNLLPSLPDTPLQHELEAQICRGMGDIFDRVDYPQALTWFQSGLDALGTLDSPEKAYLLICLGDIHTYLANYEAAKQAIEQGLSLLAPNPSRVRAKGHISLGIIYWYQGDSMRSHAEMQRGLAISEQTHDQYMVSGALINLGVLRFMAGEHNDAIAIMEQVPPLLASLNSAIKQTDFEINLGTMYLYMGQHEKAQQHLDQSIQIARQRGLQMELTAALHSLVELEMARGNGTDDTGNTSDSCVLDYLDEAASLIQITGAQQLLPENHRLYAQVYLRQDNREMALHHIEQAIHVAKQLALSDEIEVSLDLHRQILNADA
ncbi:MAG: CHAT domain-containing protein [Chloroflexota bacterium]